MFKFKHQSVKDIGLLKIKFKFNKKTVIHFQSRVHYMLHMYVKADLQKMGGVRQMANNICSHHTFRRKICYRYFQLYLEKRLKKKKIQYIFLNIFCWHIQKLEPEVIIWRFIISYTFKCKIIKEETSTFF